jgi:addiction module RelE/StbE family toxin
MVQINRTFQAKSDLKSIANYISRDSEKYAKLQVIRHRNRTKILQSQVYSGRIVPELNHSDIRELIEGNYRIIYRIADSIRVDILKVHHSTHNFKSENL